MSFNYQYNPNAEEEQGFPPIPKNYYVCIINDAVWDETKAKDGSYIKFELIITDGPFKDRKVWDYMMMEHSNPDVVKRGQDRLSLAYTALGIVPTHPIEDLPKFRNFRGVIDVKIESTKEKDSEKYRENVRGYRKAVGFGIPNINQRTLRNDPNKQVTLRNDPNQQVTHTQEDLTEDDIPF